MKRFIISFVLLFAMSAIYAESGTITVTVVSVPVTGLTTIDYEFTGIATRTYDLTVEVNFDDGVGYRLIPEDYLRGDNSRVSGTGTAFSGTIEWDGAASFPNRFHKKTRVRIAAQLVFQCGDNITFTYRGSEVTYGTIESVGLCWMDRNLGASGVATSSDDAASYGDLFQWGRFAEGHQVRTNTVHYDDGLATTSVPNDGNAWDGKFITTGSSPFDWLEDQEANLWQEVNGVNNPCPAGYRVPTEAEWDAERAIWDTQVTAGAYSSPLKLPVAGYRRRSNGSFVGVGSSGYYWSSTVDGLYSRYLYFDSTDALMLSSYRAYGLSVRCLKD